ncbi:hypothetical protein [Deinococcus humi]|uniref:Uncharacterized protein n=1 Tax=Deinococcus humi TaxID=662880 RepID=A0A7W8JVK8_9DEIO|nr:hypothetical protein [Deinococcus humi]MBB5362454.1 hypothetical protein [Deinococcus humi]GGO28756.1 hypothetical protein GCM10008949_21590 [Deinococcus humi]
MPHAVSTFGPEMQIAKDLLRDARHAHGSLLSRAQTHPVLKAAQNDLLGVEARCRNVQMLQAGAPLGSD